MAASAGADGRAEGTLLPRLVDDQWLPRLWVIGDGASVSEMETLRCALCGEIIGVYEPARARAPTERRGSRLTLRDELRAPGTIAIHERCPDGVQTARQSN